MRYVLSVLITVASLQANATELRMQESFACKDRDEFEYLLDLYKAGNLDRFRRDFQTQVWMGGCIAIRSGSTVKVADSIGMLACILPDHADQCLWTSTLFRKR